MLNREERERIRKIRDCEFYYSEKKCVTVRNGERVTIPSFPEIRINIIKNIIRLGFERVDQVAPKDANCIIRIFTKRDAQNEFGEKQVIIGYNCYVKEFTKWTSYSMHRRLFDLDFEKCEMRRWFNKEEYVTYDCEFFDTYVYIS